MQTKKLKLHRETVRNLTSDELRDVAGGRPPYPVLVKISWPTYCISACQGCPETMTACLTYADATCG